MTQIFCRTCTGSIGPHAASPESAARRRTNGGHPVSPRRSMAQAAWSCSPLRSRSVRMTSARTSISSSSCDRVATRRAVEPVERSNDVRLFPMGTSAHMAVAHTVFSVETGRVVSSVSEAVEACADGWLRSLDTTSSRRAWDIQQQVLHHLIPSLGSLRSALPTMRWSSAGISGFTRARGRRLTIRCWFIRALESPNRVVGARASPQGQGNRLQIYLPPHLALSLFFKAPYVWEVRRPRPRSK